MRGTDYILINIFFPAGLQGINCPGLLRERRAMYIPSASKEKIAELFPIATPSLKKTKKILQYMSINLQQPLFGVNIKLLLFGYNGSF